MSNLIDAMLGVLVVLFVIVTGYLVCPVWMYYKTQWAKRQFWLALSRCPRCHCPVNYDRNGRAICPDCGRPC